ncbi:hypothetical protein GJAV_G00025840 [Gymnothorax javanicus]|nr:hypothetical protein GJAV_G00025840 [Gymnothorax javanicus]
MISESSVRYEKLRTNDNYEDQVTDPESPEEEEVTVFVSQTWPHKVRQRRIGMWVRISVALLLLVLAIAFIICEWKGCLCVRNDHGASAPAAGQENGPGGSTTAPGNSGKGQKQVGVSHHHSDDHDEAEDHDHDHDEAEDHDHDHDEGEDHDHDHDKGEDHDHDQDEVEGHDHDHDEGEDHDHDHDKGEDRDHDHDKGEDHDHNHDEAEDHDHNHNEGEDHNHDQDEGEDHDHDHNDGEGDDHNENSEQHEHQHSDALFHHGVVITDSAICSEIGRKVLEEGGNVIDAGLASLLCLGVVHPHATGVGGVFSAILHNSTSGTHKAIRSISHGTPLAAYGTPATLQGIQQLHSLFGHCKWEKLFSGAAKLAQDGFQVDQTFAAALKSNREKILQSNLCSLFCDGNDTIKVLGSTVVNLKLAELLQSISLNSSSVPEGLAHKLVEDLPLEDRQGFVENMQHSGVEISDQIILEKETYSVYGATSPLSSKIISDVLEKAAEQNLSPWNNADLNSSASTYISLLTAAKLIYNSSLAKENKSVEDLLALTSVGSHVGVLDDSGNVLIISSSLNSPFGSKRALLSAGVILSDVDLNPADDALRWSCPLIVKFKHGSSDADDDDNDDDDDEVLGVGVTGGLSAPFLAAQIILNRVRGGKSAEDAVTGPLLHLEVGSSGSLSGCVSAVTNHSDVYQLLAEKGEGHWESVDSCSDSTLALILHTHLGHVRACGAPIAGAQADGY